MYWRVRFFCSSYLPLDKSPLRHIITVRSVLCVCNMYFESFFFSLSLSLCVCVRVVCCGVGCVWGCVCVGGCCVLCCVGVCVSVCVYVSPGSVSRRLCPKEWLVP